MTDYIIFSVTVIVVGYIAYRAGDFMGFARGSWGPEATKRIQSAREDSFQSGLKAGRR
jgi:hypothetical protein